MSDTNIPDWNNRISSIGSAMPTPVIPGRNNASTPPPTWPIVAPNWGRTGEVPPPPPGLVWDTGQHKTVQKRDKKLIIGLVIAALVFLFCGTIGAAVIAGSGSDKTPKPTFTTAVVQAPATSPGKALGTAAAPRVEPGVITFVAGKPFRVGDFEVAIKARKCGLTSVGTQYLDTKAQGAFCRIDLSAKNVTRSPHFYDTGSSITALDATGRKFSADGEAAVYGNSDGAGFLDEINPGNTVRANVFFDLPQGAKLDRLVFSPGVFTTADTVTVRF